MDRIGHVIGGAEVAGTAERTSPVFAPDSGKQTAEVAWATPAELETAVTTAHAAARTWGRTPVMKRADVLFRLRHLIDAHRDELAAVITAEHGKVLADSLGEVARGLENVEFACGVPHLLKGAFSERVSTDVDVHELKQPLGVTVGITPFNFPFMVPLWMAATSIACGNAFILKPSERDPSASMLLARLWREAGLPDGVFTVLNGGVDTALGLIDHPTVQAVSFVGSTPVAKAVYERSAAAGKRVQALGGAKNHLVVMPDADLAAAADAVVSGAFGSAGERCMAVSVVVAVGGVGDALVEEVVTRGRAIVTGPGDDPASGMGPLVTEAHRDKVRGYVDRAADAGAALPLDGRDELSRAGFYLGPTVLDGVTADMEAYTDEIFGPVLSVVRVDTLGEALQLIEDSPFGNGASIFCRDGADAHEFSQRVDVGMVGVNVPVPVPAAHFSFGGWKGSLFGDCHIYGPESVQFYTRTKVVTSRWVPTAGVDLNFPGTR